MTTYGASITVRVKRVHSKAYLATLRHVTPTINYNRNVLTVGASVAAIFEKSISFFVNALCFQDIIEWE